MLRIYGYGTYVAEMRFDGCAAGHWTTLRNIP